MTKMFKHKLLFFIYKAPEISFIYFCKIYVLKIKLKIPNIRYFLGDDLFLSNCLFVQWKEPAQFIRVPLKTCCQTNDEPLIVSYEYPERVEIRMLSPSLIRLSYGK